MFSDLVITELIKYRRTMIPWMVGAGGVMASGIAFLQGITGDPKINWEVLAGSGMNLMNILALLLVAVFSGHVFAAEYHENIASMVFTYPVSRLKIYIVKHLVILFLVISLYMIFFISTIAFGFTGIGNFPATDFLLKFLKVALVVSAANYVLVPVTALVSLLVKGIGTYILAGLSYFLIYMSFSNSEYSLLIPMCIPDKLAVNFLIAEFIGKSDFTNIIIASAVTFLSAFFIGAFYYSRSDMYK